jgi:signal transduction histidine kinase
MRYRPLGRTGLRVSALCLAAMVFGDRRGSRGASPEEAGSSLPGAGLGRSIVSRIVRDNGGQVRLEPVTGGGTIAWVWSPGSTAQQPR